MTLIVSKNGKNAKRISRTSFGNEDELQQYIHDNPDVIPLNDIDEDIRLLILAREFYTESGPIDAVGIDANGQIYLIETKLYKNQDKRHVVAQVLDYGAALWRHYGNFEVFHDALERSVQAKWKMSLETKIETFFELPAEEIPELLALIRSNLDEGVFKFVVLMDQLHDRLKDLLRFINRYSRFSLYAVEVEYYKHDSYEIMIPRLFGAEVKKDAITRHTSRQLLPTTVDEHFEGSYAASRPLYDKLLEELRKIEPAIEIFPRKPHIAIGIRGKRFLYIRSFTSKLNLFLARGYQEWAGKLADPKEIIKESGLITARSEADIVNAVAVIRQILVKEST